MASKTWPLKWLGGLDKLQEWLRDYNAVMTGTTELKAFFSLSGEEGLKIEVQPD